jgi:hypothetical protein
MPRLIWMLDIAREQNPTDDHLRRFARHALDSGYDALGLYLEHRFAYPSTPWAHGGGCITPESVKMLREEFPALQVIPFINLLGHMEGFLYCEEGREFRAEPFRGLQAAAHAPGFAAFADQLLEDTLEAFDSDWIHIGGDETAQLDKHPLDKVVVEGAEGDGKAVLYGEHFGRLCRRVIAAGRTPAIWGDMLLDHPQAADYIPKETVVFDWQYRKGLQDSAPVLKEMGYRVIGCPTLHVYSAPWMHVEASERNVREVARDVRDLDLDGFCLTTWESGLMSSVDSILPAVKSSAAIAREPDSETTLLDDYAEGRDWARMMGVDMEKLGGVFGYSGWRSSLKTRLLLMRNPFMLWFHHHEELCGPSGQAALRICEQALFVAPGEAEQGITLFVRGAIEFTLLAEEAHRLYEGGDAEGAVAKLAPTRYLFDTLEQVARRTHSRIGGSRADMERCKLARERVEQAIRMIRSYGRGEMGYRPAFEVITHPNFVPYDQGCWWLINEWAR